MVGQELMRQAIALDESTGCTNCQNDEPRSYHEILEVTREDYEVVAAVPMAQVSWSDARPMCERLKDASDLAILLEARRRGYEVARQILETQI
jgi:hypothetical protein